MSTPRGELVVVTEVILTSSEARTLTDEIRQTLTLGHDLLIRAYTGRAWTALGYASWDAYCGGEFSEARMVRLDREQRREIVAEMRDAGMSSRAIASGLGAPPRTIARDIAEAPVPNGTPAAPVTGMDGKTYQPPAPRSVTDDPPPAPRPSAPARRAITDAFFDAAFDLQKAVDRVVRLAADDRFPRNAQQVAAKHRSDLLRTHEALAGVLALLPETVTDEQFESAITEAEGNLSRANVVRKIKGEPLPQGKRPEHLARTRHHDSNRIVEQTVIALEGLCLGIDLIDDARLNAAQIPAWTASLRVSLRTLNRLAKEIQA